MNINLNKETKLKHRLFTIAVYLFAAIGLLFSGVFVAMHFNLLNVKGGIDSLSQYFNSTRDNAARRNIAQQTVKYWTDTPDWQVMSIGFIKDKELIIQASDASGVSPRTIVSTIIAEQFRFFNSNREAFKKFFQPLQILGNNTQFSYGIAGIKTDTAKMIEDNLKDVSSPYYPGPAYEHLLDFSTPNQDTERMNRLTDTKNHYYSYLYTGLLLKEEMTQWQNAGYPIDNRPEILATLFNIGFLHSKPNANPETGGSTFDINGRQYTFGGLAFDFYYSNQLLKEFPN
ncbi:MAG: hypothetical protein KGI58_00475 [Patescibacteria group bacterium]|nr:hypothetical protein [Patescibacteria group bacterium]